MKHRVALAREQSVDIDTAFCRQLFEASPLQFMSDEHFTLLDSQFIERKFQLIKQHAADIERFRPGVGRWQKIFDLQHLAVFILDSRVTEGLRPLLAEKVRDAIARD